MDTRREIAALAESEEERMLLIRTSDRLLRGMEREQPVCSAFLTQREQALVRTLLPGCAFWGRTRCGLLAAGISDARGVFRL